MLSKIINYFIPPQSNSKQDDLRTERIFVAVIMISAISNLIGISLAIEIELQVVGYLLFANALINILLLFLFKNGLSKNIAANIILSQQAISFALQAYYQGGLSSPATAAFFLLPAVAMLIIGKKGAIFWMVISVLMTIGFFVFETYFGSITAAYNMEKKNIFLFNSLLGINVTIFFVLLVYENGKSRALKNVQAKNTALLEAQAQLIQSEKMASLGELTAGIAHEIQNPLNFVNNFSELNIELIDELAAEVENENLKEVKAIANDIKENEQKINHHGKRAEAIVKGMLQHSRTNSGEKELTDINALADEYLRLSYHGLQAKDKSFNAEFKTEFDETLPKINVVPQDIGRVLLNLINNAFYAVDKKAKESIEDYKPMVTVSSKLTNSPLGGSGGQGVQITVTDNGPGIPQEFKDKIFQPFFTTKPTGSGTGLGLSLSYDIVKAHGGEIEVESKVGEGTVFIIQIPLN